MLCAPTAMQEDIKMGMFKSCVADMKQRASFKGDHVQPVRQYSDLSEEIIWKTISAIANMS